MLLYLQQGAHVPKFGDWGSGDEAPNYTDYFDKAREDRGGGKVINPNNPQANPSTFPNSTGTRTEPAADDQLPHQRHGARGGGSGGHPGRQGTGSPLHPQKGSASPGGEGKNSYNSSHGGAGKSRMKPADQGDETVSFVYHPDFSQSKSKMMFLQEISTRKTLLGFGGFGILASKTTYRWLSIKKAIAKWAVGVVSQDYSRCVYIGLDT